MKRESKSVTSSLERRLNSYALAASAAGVGMLALAQPSEAKIVYTKAHQQIAPNTRYNLDLNHDRITDFTFLDYSNGGVLNLNIPRGNFVRGYSTNSRNSSSSARYASALRAGAKVGPGKKYLPPGSCRASSCFVGMAFYLSNTFGFFVGGPWLNATNRYLGLKFLISGKTHYGWARLDSYCAKFICNALLTGYAYETIPNKAIITGKTKGPDVNTVEGASLGHLARGRRQRNSDR